MFQIVVVLRRKPGMSTKAFRQHWKEIHGPLFRKFSQIKKYTQYHVSDHARDSSDLPIDGVAILEFDSKEEMKKAWEMLAYKGVRKDELNLFAKGATGVHVVYVDEMVNIIGN